MDGIDALKKVLTELKSVKVLVGIPDSGTGSRGISNAELAFIHSHGSPINHIPARPFLEPAIEDPKTMERITECMKNAFEQMVEGNRAEAISELHKAGIYGENAAKDYFGSANLAPNAPITVEGGWMRNRVSGKPFKVKGKGSSAPLIDTGNLRSSVTHIVEGE